jgi:hypothetical protein
VEDGSGVDVVLLRRAYTIRNGGLAIAAMGAFAWFSTWGDSRILWAGGLTITGALMALLGLEGNAERIDARLDPLGVRVADRCLARREAFRAAWIERDGTRTCVHILVARSGVRLEASDVADGHRLLRLLGLDRSQTVLRLPLYPAAIWANLLASVVMNVTFQSFLHSDTTRVRIALGVFLAALIYGTTFFCFRGEMVIGADGVLLWRPLRSRFLPFSEIQSVDCPLRTKLVVRSREGKGLSCSMSATATQAALEAIESSLASVGGEPEALSHRLRRETSDEDAASWVTRLRALAMPSSYRTGGLGTDVLWRVIDDPGASASERAAAAVALDVNATTEERRRLHEVAARIAEPHVRVAIEHVAARASAPSEGSAENVDDSLIAALAAVRDARTSRPER